MAKRPGMLDPLRVRIRRLQLIIGVGLIACVLGALISIPISFRILPLVSGSPLWIFEAVRTLVSQLWAYGVLPALFYGLARIIDLKPWTAAVGAVITGVLFQLSISLISRGFEGVIDEHPARAVMMVLTAAGGVWVCAFAVKSARAAAHRAEEEARKKADSRKDEYAAFAREAERLANRTEARDQASAVPPDPAATAAPADAAALPPATDAAAPVPGEPKSS